MATDVCEHCGHLEMAHMQDRCLHCEADRECNPKFEVCPGFKPDMFNMWKDADEDNHGPQPS